MKINHRIILVNLLIVAIVLGSAAIAFYSIMYNTLTAQQTNTTSSSRNFIFTYRTFINKIDEEFWTIKNNNPEFFFDRLFIAGNINDFFLEASTSDSNLVLRYSSKTLFKHPKRNLLLMNLFS